MQIKSPVTYVLLLFQSFFFPHFCDFPSARGWDAKFNFRGSLNPFPPPINLLISHAPCLCNLQYRMSGKWQQCSQKSTIKDCATNSRSSSGKWSKDAGCRFPFFARVSSARILLLRQAENRKTLFSFLQLVWGRGNPFRKKIREGTFT